METKANHLLIGGFVLLVLAMALSFVYWMRNGSGGGDSVNYHVIFEGSVQGLSDSSTVQFNGLRVGSVETLEIMAEDTRKVRALISVRKGTPVRENSRARISQQGLAGFVALEITPGTPDAAFLAPKPGEAFAVIYAEKAGSGSILGDAPEANGSARALFERLNDLVANNEGDIRQIIRDIASVTAMLNENKDNISAIISDARAVSGRFKDMADKLDATLDKVSGALVDNPNSLVTEAQQALRSFRELAEKLDRTVGDQAEGLSRSAQRGLREFELFMKEARRLAESLERVVEKLERNPSGYILGGDQTPAYQPKQ
jgi:phospholipid/cholesterol/gamma-HCH transport system substrate-binding protein